MLATHPRPPSASPPILAERGWRLRLHAPCGALTEEIAAACRALRAVLADPAGVPTIGFALLRPTHGGGLGLIVHRWTPEGLLRNALLLPENGAAPRRCPRLAEALGGVDDLLLLAREAEAWRRHVLDAAVPDLDGYLAEPAPWV